MADDFLTTLGVADPADSKPGAAPTPMDAALRTIWAESNDPTERQWIAGVIANRAKAGKKSLGDVVTEAGQFEPWSDPAARKRMDGLDPTSDEYQALLKDVGPILRGEKDPSGGATSFYAPQTQKKLGRPPPGFEDGSGVDVGQTRFFGGTGKAPDEFLSALGVDHEAAEKAATDPEDPNTLKFAGTPVHSTRQQTDTFMTLHKGGLLDDKQPLGSERNPYGVQPGMTEKDVPAGAYYVPPGGGVKRAPGGEKESSALAGVGQGAADVFATLSHAVPGTDDSDVKNALLGSQMLYGAKYGGDLASGTGRFLGQMGVSAPLLGAGEALAAPVLGAAGAPGAFLTGKGSLDAVPGVLRLLGRGSSLATHAAIQGAGAAGLTSSANEGSLPVQMGEGALGGAVLGPMAPVARGLGRWAGGTVRSLAEPLTGGGQEKIVNRLIGNVATGDVAPDFSEIVPGSRPTLAEASGDAGLATLQRNVQTHPKLAAAFQARADQNSTARGELFDKLKGDEQTVQDLKDARDTATAGVREAAFKGAKPADPSQIIATIDEILKGPSGQRDVVTKALGNIRSKLVTEQGPQTDVEQLYGIRKAIGDMLSPMAPSDQKGSQLATAELMKVKGEIDKAIETAAPGFKGYLKTFADLSKPVDEQEFLQSLRLTDKNQNLTLARVQNGLDRIDAMRRKSGANPAKSISDDTLTQLRSVRDDLKRAGNIDLGKARGSDTVQNLATHELSNKLGIPMALGFGLHHPVLAPAVAMGRVFYGMKSDQLLDRLGGRMLNPETLPAVASPKKPLNRVLKRLASPVLPAAGAALTNRILSP